MIKNPSVIMSESEWSSEDSSSLHTSSTQCDLSPLQNQFLAMSAKIQNNIDRINNRPRFTPLNSQVIRKCFNVKLSSGELEQGLKDDGEEWMFYSAQDTVSKSIPVYTRGKIFPPLLKGSIVKIKTVEVPVSSEKEHPYKTKLNPISEQ